MISSNIFSVKLVIIIISLGLYVEIYRSSSSYVVGLCLSSVLYSNIVTRPVYISTFAIPTTVDLFFIYDTFSIHIHIVLFDISTDSELKNVPGEYIPSTFRLLGLFGSCVITTDVYPASCSFFKYLSIFVYVNPAITYCPVFCATDRSHSLDISSILLPVI